VNFKNKNLSFLTKLEEKKICILFFYMHCPFVHFLPRPPLRNRAEIPPQGVPLPLFFAAWQFEDPFAFLHFCGRVQKPGLLPQVVPELANSQFFVQHPNIDGGSHCSPASVFPIPHLTGAFPGGLIGG